MRMRLAGRVGALVATIAVAATMTAYVGPPATAARTSGSCALPRFGPGATYAPRIDRASFTPDVTNPWFPLRPGRTLLYTGTKDGKAALDVFEASRATRVIDGVTTRVVEDRLFLGGKLEERTSDYYAQDACGNVWYFGEDTAELDARGRVIDTSGSFHAGIDGAQPGVFMQARPTLGRSFRQEWYRGEAEDTFHAVRLSTPVKVPYGSFLHALKTLERTALEPGVLDAKYYVKGIGQVEEVSLRGPREKLVLVDVIS